MTISLILISICAFLIVYHHVIYAFLVRFMTKNSQPLGDKPLVLDDAPSIGVFIAAHNEEEYIYDKLLNLAIQDYPSEKIAIHLLLDGCTDGTKSQAEKAIRKLQKEKIYCCLEEFRENKGKVAALNYLIARYKDTYNVAVFSDVSSLLSMDTFHRIAQKMSTNGSSVVSGIYQLMSPGTDNQDKYWQYQNKLRLAESDLGAVIGVPGAMFAVRTDKLVVLPEETINDDFVISMLAQDEQNRASIDRDINIVEMEQDQAEDDFKRRIRIAAGNLQQVFMLKQKLRPQMGWLAFNFFSGKVLRAFMPLCFLVTYLTGYFLAYLNVWPMQWGMALLTSMHIVGLGKLVTKSKVKLPVVDQINYMVFSYFTGLVGIVHLLMGQFDSPWQRVHQQKRTFTLSVLPIKRLCDVIGAIFGLLISAPFLLLAAVAIKLDSRGPVIYRQMRVGRVSDKFVELIYIYKLRSMVNDAEEGSGAVWAGKGDPRVTRVGRFLRKTRIDELPQFWNVLKGEMSLIGPRPERPAFYNKLEKAIPYFSQRTYLLKPGISGLAQVMNGYDETLEDAKNKIAWDYAYSLSTSSFSSWSRMELNIFVKTIKVVLTGKGQ